MPHDVGADQAANDDLPPHGGKREPQGLDNWDGGGFEVVTQPAGQKDCNTPNMGVEQRPGPSDDAIVPFRRSSHLRSLPSPLEHHGDLNGRAANVRSSGATGHDGGMSLSLY